MGIKDIHIRMFAYFQDDDYGVDIKEIDISEFESLATDFHVSYERHSIFQNGARQVCLTIDNKFQPIGG